MRVRGSCGADDVHPTASGARLFLDGIDTETGKSVLVDLFRCKFNPVGTLAMIHEEYGNLPLTGSVLYDPLNAGDPMLGGYGRYIEKKAA